MRRFLLVTALAAAFCGAASAQQAQFERPYWLNRSVIEVIGRARIETPANRARFSVTFQETAHDAAEAQANAADRARLAAAAMRASGHADVQISSNIGVEPNFEEYRDHDGNVQQRTGPENVSSYTARVTMSVRVLDTAKAGAVRAAAFAVGPEDSTELQYYLDAPGELQRRVYVAAVQDAAARARAAAQAAGAGLGPLLVLQEGQGPCLGQWNRGDYGGGGYPPPAPPPPPAMSSEDVVVTGSRANRRLTLTPQQISRLQLPDDVSPLGVETSVCAVYAAGGAAAPAP